MLVSMKEFEASDSSSLSDLGVSNIFSVKINKQHISPSEHFGSGCGCGCGCGAGCLVGGLWYKAIQLLTCATNGSVGSLCKLIRGYLCCKLAVGNLSHGIKSLIFEVLKF